MPHVVPCCVSSASVTCRPELLVPMSLSCDLLCLHHSDAAFFCLSCVSHYACVVKVLLDIGAGQGLFSLAAAARGHQALAFELSAKSLASLEASVAFSSLSHLLHVHKVSLHQCSNTDHCAAQTSILVRMILDHVCKSQSMLAPVCVTSASSFSVLPAQHKIAYRVIP